MDTVYEPILMRHRKGCIYSLTKRNYTLIADDKTEVFFLIVLQNGSVFLQESEPPKKNDLRSFVRFYKSKSNYIAHSRALVYFLEEAHTDTFELVMEGPLYRIEPRSGASRFSYSTSGSMTSSSPTGTSRQ